MTLAFADSPTWSGRLAKIYGFYDNEWGYSNRLVDLIAHAGSRLADG